MRRKERHGLQVPFESAHVDPVFAHLLAVSDVDVGKERPLAAKIDYLEPLSRPACPYLLGIEASNVHTAELLGELHDKSGLPRTR